jgi:hypothetical protein
VRVIRPEPREEIIRISSKTPGVFSFLRSADLRNFELLRESSDPNQKKKPSGFFEIAKVIKPEP